MANSAAQCNLVDKRDFCSWREADVPPCPLLVRCWALADLWPFQLTSVVDPKCDTARRVRHHAQANLAAQCLKVRLLQYLARGLARSFHER